MTAPAQPARLTLYRRLAALWGRRWFKALCFSAVTLAVFLAVATLYLALHIQPILKARVTSTLSRRFNSPVELDALDISILRGIEVRGSGLRIQYLAGPGQPDPRAGAGDQAIVEPMLSVDRFAFHTSLRQLAELRTRIGLLSVDGLELHIPPHASTSDQRAAAKSQALVSLLIDHIRCRNVRLFIETDKPGKGPGITEIPSLDLVDVGRDRALDYDAVVLNPKPRATIHATGHLGPWVGTAPRETPLDGAYTVNDMDLATVKGIGGVLRSQGSFTGDLGHVTVDGTAATRNFSLDVSNHPMPLTARFHALVDGTSGDTTLAPVEARLGHSDMTISGTILRVQPGSDIAKQGHDIVFDIHLPRGRIEDLLEVGMKTNPPCMRGAASLQAHLHIPPGPERVPAKLQLAGTLHLQDIAFTNSKLQAQIDDISTRATGHPRAAQTAGPHPEVTSQMSVAFTVAQALLTASKVKYEAPGLDADLAGAYSLDGTLFDFRGRARTRAAPSQMVTGWKSWLLKGLDPFTKKGDFGLVIPVEISGAKNDIKLGIPMHGVDDTARQIATQMKAGRKTARLPSQ